MDKAKAAEWVLRRVVDRAKASEVVGDLMETHLHDGNRAFWFSMCHVVFAFSYWWEPLLVIVLIPLADAKLSLSLHKRLLRRTSLVFESY